MKSPQPKPIKRKSSGVTYHLVRQHPDEHKLRLLCTAIRANGIAAMVDKLWHDIIGSTDYGLFVEQARTSDGLAIADRVTREEVA